MPLKDTKYDQVYKQMLGHIASVSGVPAHFLGVDHGKGPDQNIISQPCWKCGVYRKVNSNFIVEKCPGCGDGEIDLSAPDGSQNDRKEETDQNPKIPPVSPAV